MPSAPKYTAAPFSWTALKFAIPQPHRYAYKFESSGTYGAAQFTATAYGDLDCDGEWSTFELHGKAEPTSKGAECDMATGSEVIATKPEE
jgi:hypothetical protein